MEIKKIQAFTMVELLLAVGIGAAVLASASGLYLTGANVCRKAAAERELSRNGRAAIERITREIRQAEEIAMVISQQEEESSSEIMLRSGQDENALAYVRYYLEGIDLRRQEGFYYFESDPEKTPVPWNAAGHSGENPLWEINEDEIAAENFSKIEFFGNPLVRMRFSLRKAGVEINLASAALSRNMD